MYGIVWCSSCWHGKDDGHMSLESPSKGPHRDTHPSHESGFNQKADRHRNDWLGPTVGTSKGMKNKTEYKGCLM